MANEQTAYVGDSVKVLVNVIDANGSHAAAVIDTTTTRLDGLSTVPTVTTIATGIYEIVFSGVTPAPAEGDRLVCKVNGTMAGTAWTEYGIPIKIVADERGTDNASTFDSATDTVTTANAQDVSDILNSLPSNFDLMDIDAANGEVASQLTTEAIYLYFTASNRQNQFKADVSAIEAKTNQLTFTVSNQVDANTLTGGISEAGVRSAVGLASANLDTQLGNIDTATTGIKATTDQFSFTVANQVDANSLTGGTSPADIYAYLTSSNREDAFKATGFATVNADNASIAAIKEKTDSLTFTIANQVDANAVTGGGEPIGSGAISHTVTASIDGNPAPSVDVWVSTDAAGTNVVAGTLATNNAGQATFQLDAGSYYLWCQQSGVNFTNPTAFTVS